MNGSTPHNLPIFDAPESRIVTHREITVTHIESQPESQPVLTAAHPPKMVFVALSVVLFFCVLSVADSLGFVPYYIDGTPSAAEIAAANPSDLTSNIALSNLPQLGEDNVEPSQPSSEFVVTSGDTVNTGIGTLVIPSPQSRSRDNKTVVDTAPLATSQHSLITPTRLIIGSVGIDLPVQNPATQNIDALDALLVAGPARYSGSAKLGENGNVVIFAHSSHLPIVHNQMFRAFNKVPDLQRGDSITLVGSDGKKYRYSVTSVEKATTDDGATIDLSSSLGQRLTLVTCDTLTGKSARFVLSAEFVGIE